MSNYIDTSSYLMNEIMYNFVDIENKSDRTERLKKIQSDIKLLKYILYSVQHTEKLYDELNEDLNEIYTDATNAINAINSKDRSKEIEYLLKISHGKISDIYSQIYASRFNEIPVTKDQFIQYVRDIYNITDPDYYINKDIEYILRDIIRDAVRASRSSDLSSNEKEKLYNIFSEAYNVMDKPMDEIIESLRNINDLSQDILREYPVQEPTLQQYMTLIYKESIRLKDPYNGQRRSLKILSGYISIAKLLFYVNVDDINLYTKMNTISRLVEESYNLTDITKYTDEALKTIYKNINKIIEEWKLIEDTLKTIKPIIVSQQQACQYLHNIYNLSNDILINPNKALEKILRYLYFSNQFFKDEKLSLMYIQIFDTLTTLKQFDRQHDILRKIKNISLQYIHESICTERSYY